MWFLLRANGLYFGLEPLPRLTGPADSHPRARLPAEGDLAGAGDGAVPPLPPHGEGRLAMAEQVGGLVGHTDGGDDLSRLRHAGAAESRSLVGGAGDG